MGTDACSEILEQAYTDAEAQLTNSFVTDTAIKDRIAYAALCPSNRAGARFLLAATLAKVNQPEVDIRKPFIQAYPESEKSDAYPGRNYDETYVFDFITKKKLLACSPQLDPALMRVQTARLGKETLDGTTQTAQSGTDHRQAA